MVGEGPRVGSAHVDLTVDGSGINDDIIDAVDEGGIEKAGERGGEKYGDGFSEGFLSRMRGKIRARMASVGDRIGSDLGSRISEQLGDRLASRPEQMRRGVEEAFDEDFAERIGGQFGDALSDSLGERIELAIARATRDIATVMEDMETRRRGVSGNLGPSRGDRIGRMFGAGARNNALNLFGRSIGGTINLTDRLQKGIGGLFRTFAKGFKTLEDGGDVVSRLTVDMSAFAAIGGRIGSALGSLIASGPALLAVSLAIAALVSVMSALLGIVTALASTIVSALVGALAVLGGALAAVTAGVGLLTVAFMSMTDAQRRVLKDAFIPLKEEMVGIGQIMLQEMVPAFNIWSQNLQRAVALIAPFAQAFGRAFADAGSILTEAFSGPGFQAFAAALGNYLPSIITRLSSALGSFLNGLLGLFSAIMPYVDQFAGYLARVADNFSRWANSTEGQNAITDFVDRALVSLQSLWNFLGQIGGLLSDVLFSAQGQNAGNTLFDDMANAVERFRASISNGDLERWFNDAITFAEALGDVIRGLASAFAALESSGVIKAISVALSLVGKAMEFLAWISQPTIEMFGVEIPNVFKALINPIGFVWDLFDWLGKKIEWLGNLFGWVGDAVGWVADKLGLSDEPISAWIDPYVKNLQAVADQALRTAAAANAMGAALGAASMRSAGLLGGAAVGASLGAPSIEDTIRRGNAALTQTSRSRGGYRSNKYRNPYVRWANSLIDEGPGYVTQLRRAMRDLNRQTVAVLNEAERSIDSGEVRDSLLNMYNSLRERGQQGREQAQNALNSAARNLANANSARDARQALREVRAAQRALSNTIKEQRRLNAAASLLARQRSTSNSRINKLLSGERVTNATLADYAAARGRVAERIEEANQKLADAISLRDTFRDQVTESIRSFGALVSAEAQNVDGVAQALTAGDVTANLQDRLDRIKKFQDDLRLLLAQGLSESAYKQLVEAGVEGGAATAAAIAAGGQGAVNQVNSLVSQIDNAAGTLGEAASSHLYQAGVDAAQGLIDGLKSLDAQLQAAATALGNSIAKAVAKALGIKSPSRVLYSMMYDDVGDGMVNGLNDAQAKVGTAASALASKVAVSPEVAAHAARQGETPVSGNDPKFLWTGDIVTPTEDPHAVATEALNELTGRLT